MAKWFTGLLHISKVQRIIIFYLDDIALQKLFSAIFMSEK